MHPVEQERITVEVMVFADAEDALREGHDAYACGDLAFTAKAAMTRAREIAAAGGLAVTPGVIDDSGAAPMAPEHVE